MTNPSTISEIWREFKGRYWIRPDGGVPPSGSGLRPHGAETRHAAQAEPLVPNAQCLMVNCGRRAPDDHPMCSKHR